MNECHPPTISSHKLPPDAAKFGKSSRAAGLQVAVLSDSFLSHPQCYDAQFPLVMCLHAPSLIKVGVAARGSASRERQRRLLLPSITVG